jgi:sugar/nucleoside kinase (ribokinase family)
LFTDVPSTNALVVYGHVGFDVSTVAGKVTRTVGGGAYYAAMAAAAQGAQVRLVSILGADFPEAALNPGLIPLRTATPSAILLTTAPPSQQARALEWLQAQEFRGLIAIDTCLAYVTEFDVLLQRNGCRIGVLFVNAAEFEALAQRPPLGTRTIVKRGSQGASLLENGVWSHVLAPVAEQVRTITGAGDVFAGAFLAACLNGESSAKAVAGAVAFATSYVKVGAECFHQTCAGDSV